jgi:hypothetical protein
MESFKITELAIFITAIMSSLGGLCMVIQKSKCKNINMCCGLMKCERDEKAIEMDIEKGQKNSPRIAPPVPQRRA